MTRTEARQYLIDHCNPYYPQGDTKWDNAMNTAIKALEEPERKKGKWIERNPYNSPEYRLIECSECGKAHIVDMGLLLEDWAEGRNFCIRCGADMRGDDHD